jgi:dynein heavy chain
MHAAAHDSDPTRRFRPPPRPPCCVRPFGALFARCSRASISISDILDGDVALSMEALSQSIAAGDAWRSIYHATEEAVKKRSDQLTGAQSSRTWELDRSSIFAQIDAFVQRCRDLQEVCEGQTQFARRAAGGKTAELPVFGGARGAEVSSQLLAIQASFEKHVSRFRALTYDILDVKATRWHDDYNTFKNSLKDLEVMFQNVINTAFDGASTTDAGVQLLDAFNSLAQREAIKRAVEKKSAEVFTNLTQELSLVKKGFDKQKATPPLIHRDHPRYAGAALWAKSLHTRIQRQWALLEASAKTSEDLSNQTAEARQAHEQYALLDASLDEYIRKMYSEWITTIEAGMGRFLESYLMVRSQQPLARGTGRERYTYLEQNFDRTLLQLFSEVQFWEKLRFEIPYVAMDIATHRERYRCLRENVMLVVREYNAILDALAPAERRLFAERLHYLDRKIYPGLTKLTWASKGVTDVFIKEIRRHELDTSKLVASFHHSKALLAKMCRQVASTPLVALKKKQVYVQELFESEQRAHQEDVRGKLTKVHLSMRDLMKSTHETFRSDVEEVQREWASFVEQIDRSVEDALRQTVKKSLQELSRSINGDAKTEVQSLFRIQVVLHASKVEFKPSIAELSQTVNNISKDAIATTGEVPRLTEKLAEDDKKEGAPTLPSFYAHISNDEDILKVLVQVMTGMREIIPRLQKYLNTWDRYKHIWDVDKDAFMRRYAKANRALTAFETDITRYKELAHDIQSEEGISNIGFIRIDCQPLKQALTSHCHAWQNKFTQLLNTNAATELTALFDHMTACMATLDKRAQNLDQLAEQINLFEAEQGAYEKTEGRFEPLETQYRMLEKFEVQIKETELAKLASLRTEWASYKAHLHDANMRLQKTKADFKDDLLQSLTDFGTQTQALRSEFVVKAPFFSDITPAKAKQLIAEYRTQVDAVYAKAADMQAGLKIFSIEPPVNKETSDTVKVGGGSCTRTHCLLCCFCPSSMATRRHGLTAVARLTLCVLDLAVVSDRIWRSSRSSGGWLRSGMGSSTSGRRASSLTLTSTRLRTRRPASRSASPRCRRTSRPTRRRASRRGRCSTRSRRTSTA